MLSHCSSTISWKDYSFCVDCLGTFVENQWAICLRMYFWIFCFVLWSICLSLHQYHTVSVYIASWYILKSGNTSLLTFLPKNFHVWSWNISSVTLVIPPNSTGPRTCSITALNLLFCNHCLLVIFLDWLLCGQRLCPVYF